MRLNLNFRDSTITRIDQSTFKITFDLQNMNKPRLTNEARMYIENFNLPEFIDETFGDKGNLRGYFELRCKNVTNNDYDTELGNSGDTIIYTSPLQNYKTFVNHDPMYISNFKINQNFLQDKLVLTMKIYDQNGDPYTTAETLAYDIDKTKPEYTTYITKINELDILNQEKDDVDKLIKLYETTLQTKKENVAFLNTQFNNDKQRCFTEFDTYTSNRKHPLRGKLRIESTKILLDSYDVNLYSYFFEIYLTGKRSSTPYNSLTELDPLYEALISLSKAKLEEFQTNEILKGMYSNESNIWYDFTPRFDPNDKLIKANSISLVNYEVLSGGAPIKEGTLDITVLNSKIPLTGVIDNVFIVGNITPLNNTAAHKLTAGDELVIDKANTLQNIPIEYTYNFYKETLVEASFTITDTDPTVTIPSSNDKKVSFSVSRDASLKYTVAINDNTNDIKSENFTVGNVITVLGSTLGGTDGTHDLIFNVTGVIPLLPTELYTITAYQDNPTNGNFDITILRDNTTQDYSIDAADFTNTELYNVKDTITIDGKLYLDGVTGVNDAILTVTSVYDNDVYIIDPPSSFYILPKVSIDDVNSIAYDASGAVKVVAGFTIDIQAIDGIYSIDTATTISFSTDFVAGDELKILGSTLSGVDGVNDLILEPVINAGGVTEGFTIKSGVARNPVSYEFEVTIPLYSTVYSVVYNSGDDFQIGDKIEVKATTLGIASGATINDLVITITDNTAGAIQFTTTGIPINEGKIGEIKTVDIAGKGIKKTRDGVITTANITVTKDDSVDTTTLVGNDIKIVLNQELTKGRAKIEAEKILKKNEVMTAKTVLVPSLTRYLTNIGSYQETKLKSMNMKLVLYDEVPEYTQASKDAISGNTYSRLNACQFKRI